MCAVGRLAASEHRFDLLMPMADKCLHFGVDFGAVGQEQGALRVAFFNIVQRGFKGFDLRGDGGAVGLRHRISQPVSAHAQAAGIIDGGTRTFKPPGKHQREGNREKRSAHP